MTVSDLSESELKECRADTLVLVIGPHHGEITPI